MATFRNTCTRSSPDVWLLGKPTANLSHAHLPTKGDTLRIVMFHHQEEKATLSGSFRLAAHALLEVWNKARILTQSIDSMMPSGK